MANIQITLNDYEIVKNEKNFTVCEIKQVVVAINNNKVTVQSRYGKQYEVELCSTLSADDVKVFDYLLVRKYKDGRWVAVENMGNPNKFDSCISSEAFVDAFMNY